MHCCYVNFYVNIKIHCVFFSSLDFIYTFCKTHLCDSFICSCTYDLEYFWLSLPYTQYAINRFHGLVSLEHSMYALVARDHHRTKLLWFVFFSSLGLSLCVYIFRPNGYLHQLTFIVFRNSNWILMFPLSRFSLQLPHHPIIIVACLLPFTRNETCFNCYDYGSFCIMKCTLCIHMNSFVTKFDNFSALLFHSSPLFFFLSLFFFFLSISFFLSLYIFLFPSFTLKNPTTTIMDRIEHLRK